MTILNFELSWYFRTWKSICRSVAKICTNMCSIYWDPIRTELMHLGGVTEPKAYVRQSKNDSKKMKIGQKSFFGAFLCFWVNLIQRIRILQKFWLLDNIYPSYGPSKFKNDKKVKKLTKSHDFFVFLGNSTMKNTNFNSVLMILLFARKNSSPSLIYSLYSWIVLILTLKQLIIIDCRCKSLFSCLTCNINHLDFGQSHETIMQRSRQ